MCILNLNISIGLTFSKYIPHSKFHKDDLSQLSEAIKEYALFEKIIASALLEMYGEIGMNEHRIEILKFNDSCSEGIISCSKRLEDYGYHLIS